MDESRTLEGDQDVHVPSRRRFLKLGLYVAPAVIAARYLGSTAHAVGGSETSEDSGGGATDCDGSSETSAESPCATKGSDVALVARNAALTGADKGAAVSAAAQPD